MEKLTKAEEQIILYLWVLNKAFLVILWINFQNLNQADTTIQTVVRVMTKKGFIGYETFGKTHQYYPLIAKDDYFRGHFKGVVKNFFNGSVSNFASFFTDDNNLSLSELERMKQLIESKIDDLKKSND